MPKKINKVANKSKGFTLAEILLTITIIGVIASSTIPGLITNYKEKSDKTRFMNLYRTIMEGNQRLIAEQENLKGLYLNYSPQYLQGLSKHVSFLKICSDKVAYGLPAMTQCIDPSVRYKYLNPANGYDYFDPNSDPDFTAGIMPNGALLFMMKTNSDYMFFDIDTNGPNKGPNQHGYDFFEFGLYFLTGQVDLYDLWGCDKTSLGNDGKGFGCARFIVAGQDY